MLQFVSRTIGQRPTLMMVKAKNDMEEVMCSNQEKSQNEALLNNINNKGKDGSMVIFQDQFVRELEKLIMNMLIQIMVQRFEVNTLSFTIGFFFVNLGKSMIRWLTFNILKTLCFTLVTILVVIIIDQIINDIIIL
jgi:hypothetical protein